MMGIAGLGLMCTLLAGDISQLEKWSDATYPAFVAGVIAHVGAVIGAFVGGKLIPTNGEGK
jgi:hypothetical protein